MDELLTIEKNNVKSLYLRGKAFYHKHDLLRACKDFGRSLQVDPEN